MKKLTLVVFALLLSASSLVFASSIQSLNKSQVMKALQDKTITTISLVTMNGKLIDNSFTGFFNKKGELQGELASKPENEPKKDQGKWMVKSDGTLCATWSTWNQKKPICVAVYKLTNGMVLVNQQNRKLETIVLDENIKEGNQL